MMKNEMYIVDKLAVLANVGVSIPVLLCVYAVCSRSLNVRRWIMCRHGQKLSMIFS